MSRKIYCLLLAFVLVLSVSCVAASDANQTADTLTQADETDGIQKVTYENTISNESTSETNGEQYTMDLKSNIDDCLQPNLISPTPKGYKNEIFWEEFRNNGLEKGVELLDE